MYVCSPLRCSDQGAKRASHHWRPSSVYPTDISQQQYRLDPELLNPSVPLPTDLVHMSNHQQLQLGSCYFLEYHPMYNLQTTVIIRSEERRVGKECRWRRRAIAEKEEGEKIKQASDSEG